MSAKPYSRSQIYLHWLSLVLILAAFFGQDQMKAAYRAVNRGTPIGDYPALHIYAGLAVLAVVALRLLLRAVRPAPTQAEDQPRWLTLSARLTHLGLYLLMVVMPVSGAVAWFFGVRSAGDTHSVLFNIGLALMGLHVAAALYHQYVVRDGLLLRMRP